jgi:TolB protein
LVFISPCKGNRETYPGAGLFIINLDGSNLTPLPNVPGGDYDPVWSPDGKWIGFVEWQKISDDKGFDLIYRIPAVGGLPIRVTSVNDSVSVGAITFTHDGKRIAFHSDRDNGVYWKPAPRRDVDHSPSMPPDPSLIDT